MVDAWNNVLLHEGNVRILPFALRKIGSREAWNVSSATKIQLELQRQESDGEPTLLAPIEANSALAGADWTNGLVPVLVGKDVTDTIGTYTGVLTVFIGGQEISVPTEELIRIEVVERPGYPAP